MIIDYWHLNWALETKTKISVGYFSFWFSFSRQSLRGFLEKDQASFISLHVGCFLKGKGTNEEIKRMWRVYSQLVILLYMSLVCPRSLHILLDHKNAGERKLNKKFPSWQPSILKIFFFLVNPANISFIIYPCQNNILSLFYFLDNNWRN